YRLIYRSPGLSQDQQTDSIDNVKIAAGQDTLQDIDMSRQAYIEKLSSEEKQHLEDLRKKNADAMKANEVIKNLNADIRQYAQDLKDADNAAALASAQLGAGAS